MKTFAAIIIALFTAVACDSLGLNEVTVYPVNCETKRPLNRITYKTSFEHQLVVETPEGGTPHQLTNCTVKDGRNWWCEDGKVKMTDGEFIGQGDIIRRLVTKHSGKQAKGDKYCYVSWWKWSWRQWREKLPIVIHLLDGLKDAFPCKKQQ